VHRDKAHHEAAAAELRHLPLHLKDQSRLEN
jgi:hypothetical protein